MINSATQRIFSILFVPNILLHWGKSQFCFLCWASKHFSPNPSLVLSLLREITFKKGTVQYKFYSTRNCHKKDLHDSFQRVVKRRCCEMTDLFNCVHFQYWPLCPSKGRSQVFQAKIFQIFQRKILTSSTQFELLLFHFPPFLSSDTFQCIPVFKLGLQYLLSTKMKFFYTLLIKYFD